MSQFLHSSDESFTSPALPSQLLRYRPSHTEARLPIDWVAFDELNHRGHLSAFQPHVGQTQLSIGMVHVHEELAVEHACLQADFASVKRSLQGLQGAGYVWEGHGW